jgi:hypothetical protein
MILDVEKMNALGRVQIQLFDGQGNLKEEHIIKNLVVTTGLNHIADRLGNSSPPTRMSHMEVGTGTTSPAAGNTALETAIASSRVALTTQTVSTNTVEYVGDFPAGTGTGAVTEAGVFNAASSGVLLCRTTFSVVNKGAADTLKITWTLTVSDT